MTCSTPESFVRAPARGAKRNALRATLGPAFLLVAAAAAAQSPAPSYIENLAPYEVRALSGALSPTNGVEVLASLTPAGTDSNIVEPWSGGGKSISGTKLFVHGGGHVDSSNNGVYVFDFNGTTRPTGWSLAVAPSIPSPVSVHTYDGTVHAHHNNYLYRFGGSRYPDGSWTPTSWKLNLATGAWTQLPNFPGVADNVYVATIYDPLSGKILVGNGSYAQAFFFRTSDDTWSSAKSLGKGMWMTGAWDPTRNRGVSIGNEGGQDRTIYAINWASETVSTSTFSLSLPISGSPGLFYDPDRDVYWAFGGTGGSGWSTLYEINAGSLLLAAAHPLSTPIPGTTAGGTYGRFVFLREWRAIGTVNDESGPAYVIKLPGATTNNPSPRPPQNLTAN